HDGARLVEDPRVADAASRDARAVYAGFVHHAKDVRRAPDVARAAEVERLEFAGVAGDQLPEKRPARRAEVFLLNRSPVDGCACVAEPDGSLEDAVEVRLSLGAVVAAAAQLDRARPIAGNSLHDGVEDGDRLLRLAEQVPAATLLADLLHRAGEVDVDNVVAERHQDL